MVGNTGMTGNFLDINGQLVDGAVKELISWGHNISENEENRTATILMKIGSIKGNITKIKDYEDSVELIGFQLEAQHKVLVGFTGNLQSSSPVKMHNFVFVMPDGPPVELLIDACDKGTLIGDVTVVILYSQANAQNEVRQQLVFKNCRVSMISSSQQRAVGSISYTNVEVDYRCVDVENKATGSVTAQFNLESASLGSSS